MLPAPVAMRVASACRVSAVTLNPVAIVNVLRGYRPGSVRANMPLILDSASP